MNTIFTGDLDKRITIQWRKPTPDGGGGSTVAMTKVCEVWAAIDPKRVSERWKAAQLGGFKGIPVVIRYHPDVAIQHEVLYGTRRFAIQGIVDPNEDHEWLFLSCEEQFG